MSFVISKLASLAIFVAWFFIGTLVIKTLDRGAAYTKSLIVSAKKA